MPIYEYICQQCGKRFERLVWSSDKVPPKCDCGGKAERIVSASFSSIKGSSANCSPSGSRFT